MRSSAIVNDRIETLARRTGKPAAEIVAAWRERAALREWIGSWPRPVAEARAMDDLEAMEFGS
jgi:hypothetical protein